MLVVTVAEDLPTLWTRLKTSITKLRWVTVLSVAYANLLYVIVSRVLYIVNLLYQSWSQFDHHSLLQVSLKLCFNFCFRKAKDQGVSITSSKEDEARFACFFHYLLLILSINNQMEWFIIALIWLTWYGLKSSERWEGISYLL